jgi:hypothetical protein
VIQLNDKFYNEFNEENEEMTGEDQGEEEGEVKDEEIERLRREINGDDDEAPGYEEEDLHIIYK